MHAVVTVTARPADELDAQPTLSFAALTSLGVTDLDPLALTVLVRSYGLDGGAAADALTLAAELGLTVAEVVELQALAAAHAAQDAGGTAGGREVADRLDEPGDDVRADLEADLATLFGDESVDDDAPLPAGRVLEARELTVLTALLGRDADAAGGDAAIAAAVGLHPLTITAYRRHLPELFPA